MKRVVVFAMVLMLGVVSVQAQWSVVPEAGMTVMKAGPMVDWKPSWKIGVGVEYQLKPEFLSLKSGLYYTQRGYSNDQFPGYGYGHYWWTVPGPTYDPYGYAYDYSNKVTRNFLQLPIMANLSFRRQNSIIRSIWSRKFHREFEKFKSKHNRCCSRKTFTSCDTGRK